MNSGGIDNSDQRFLVPFHELLRHLY
jgi:hypothetical protein